MYPLNFPSITAKPTTYINDIIISLDLTLLSYFGTKFSRTFSVRIMGLLLHFFNPMTSINGWNSRKSGRRHVKAKHYMSNAYFFVIVQVNRNLAASD